MADYIVGFLVSWFQLPHLLGLILALVFGAIWLVLYRPPLFKSYWLWAVLVASAILSVVAVAFIQIPLQLWTGQALGYFWSQDILISWLLLAGIPQTLLSGFVQEGAKMVPVFFWWRRCGRRIDPKLGLAIGAVAGAGLGVFEAVWVHNAIFGAGWSWELVQTSGIMALAGFWERFFTVAFHIASSSLVGYGLARGRGWQYYLLASLLHSFLNYGAVLYATGTLSVFQMEIFAAVFAVLVTAYALWLRRSQPVPVAVE